jgi:hypothetical protein
VTVVIVVVLSPVLALAGWVLTHRLTHRHFSASKEGVGSVYACTWRWPGAKIRAEFTPQLAGARTYRISGDELIREILAAGSAYEAMAIIRQADQP